MADARENVTEAVAGDIIGVYDTGNYQIGDTLYEGKMNVQYEELPSFTPELFMKVTAKNVMKQNLSIKEFTNWFKKEPFNYTKHI